MKGLLLILLLLFIGFVSCNDDVVKNESCNGLKCKDNSHCEIKESEPVCLCNEGYHEDENSNCVKDEIFCTPNSCTEENKNICEIKNQEIVCLCNEGYHEDENSNCVKDEISCTPNSCTEENKNICEVKNQEIVCLCNEGYHEDENSNCIKDEICEVPCEAWEKCDEETKSCILKDGRCNGDEDCNDMICDNESHYCFPAKNSWNVMPSANGIGAILFDKNQKKLNNYFPHIYKQLNENSDVTPNLLYDFYFGVRVNGQNKWLNEVEVENMEYIAGTGIIKIRREVFDLEITEYYWVTMLSELPVTIAGIKIKNLSENELRDIGVFTLGNFRVGAKDENGNHIKSEKVDYYDDLNGFYERNWVYGYEYYQVFLMSGKGNPDVVSTNNGSYNPWTEIKNNNTLTEYKTNGINGRDDSALFFQKNFSSVLPDEEKTYFVAWNTQFTNNGTDQNNLAATIKNLISDKDLDELLSDEKNYWSSWHSVEDLPSSLSQREKKLAVQSSAFIKMGQIRENIKGKGQILASLPPGIWNISWIRDMSYAIVGMAKVNHLDEANSALSFIFGNNANTGRYYSEEWSDIGHDYQISVCRYFADGDEETDWNDAGPNIEYDGFGLALWALDEYIKATGDETSFLIENRENIFNATADVIVSLVDATGLISPDSSIWEYHWSDDGYNGRRHFAYTSIMAYKGLKSAVRLGNLIGLDTSVYQTTAEDLKTAIRNNLVKNNVLINFMDEDVSGFYPENGRNIYNIDASSVEAFNFGVFDPNSEIASATLSAYEQELGNLISGSPGFKRTNKRCDPQRHASCVGTVGGITANEYDIKEWIMVDFRILSFLRKRRDVVSKEKADKLYNWILTQSEFNYLQIAELYDEQTALYAGSVPMCGFGPGAYLIDLKER